ncbi:MAG: hypothetical protein ACRD2W_11800 [Acidimicrobiales bacterium]
MAEQEAPGLTVDWLNAWLAAIGVTVLVPGVRLRWTDDPVPLALFVLRDGSPPLSERVAAAIPSLDDLQRLAIARWRQNRSELSRHVSLIAYADRSSMARACGDTSLSSSVTDLIADVPSDGLPHSPFDPPVPKGITLWERLVACRNATDGAPTSVSATLAGRGRRIASNGLGFDARRLVAGVRDAEKRVDPLLEVLAFFGTSLFPMRGNGAESRARGWTGPPSRLGAFQWCAWLPALDRWAIDALLDLALGLSPRGARARCLGISAWYRTSPYRALGSSDVTRAYGAVRGK